MSPANGHANDPANGSTSTVQQFAGPASGTNILAALTHNAAKIKIKDQDQRSRSKIKDQRSKN